MLFICKYVQITRIQDLYEKHKSALLHIIELKIY